MAVVTAEMVKTLREKTGAGIMECKKALQEKEGDIESATLYLREKGIAKAARKAHRPVGEGAIASYVHAGGKIGVLVEANCETDFVARTKEFHEMVRNLAMHVCSENPLCVQREGVPAEILERERDIYTVQARDTGKPDKIIERIVQGKMEKFFAENCLLEQPYIRDTDMTVEQYVSSISATVGERITIRRFVRFQLGETAGPTDERGEDSGQ